MNKVVGQAGIRPNVYWNGKETEVGPNWKENTPNLIFRSMELSCYI